MFTGMSFTEGSTRRRELFRGNNSIERDLTRIVGFTVGCIVEQDFST